MVSTPATPEFIRSLGLARHAVLITGGASGIGWATAQLLARAGARVMIADIDATRADSRAIELGPFHLGHRVDVSVVDDVVQMIDRCVAVFGGIDVLVNNAGLTTTGGVGVGDQTAAEFDRIMSVNLTGMRVVSEHAARAMKAAGRGVIVNLASGAGLRPVPFRGAYSASKAGIIALTRLQADLWQRDGIRVNAVAPGYTRTELVEALISSGRVDPEAAARRIPLGRMASPEEIAAAIAFLASERSAAIRGDVLVVDGGSMVGNGAAADAVAEPIAASGTAQPTYLVTGVDGVLGAAVAHTLSKQGALILSARIKADPPGSTNSSLDFGECLDVGPACDDAFAAHVQSALAGGRVLDGVVCAPAIDDNAIDHLLSVIRATGPILTSTGGGSFVTIADCGGDDGAAVDVAVLTMLTRTLAVEWCGRKVRANVVEADAGTLFRMREIADVAQFLLSREAGYVTGAVIKAHGRPPFRT